MNKKKTETNVMKVYPKALACEFGRIIKEELLKLNANKARFRRTFGGTPYLSFFNDTQKDEEWHKTETVYEVKKIDNGKRLRISDPVFIERIKEEFDIKGNAPFEIRLGTMDRNDVDSLIDYELKYAETTMICKGTAGKGAIEPMPDISECVANTPRKKDLPDENAKTRMWAPEHEDKSEMESGDPVPMASMWVRYIACDNGFVLKDDSGVMMVKESTRDETLMTEIGRAIVEETGLQNASSGTFPLGWKVEISLSPIMEPMEFFEEGGER